MTPVPTPSTSPVSIPRRANFRPSRIIVAAAIAIAVAILGALVADSYSRYHALIESAEQRVRGLNNMLAEQVALSFDSIDRVLLAAVEAREDYLWREPNADTSPPHEILRAIFHGLPIIQGVSWIDANGQRTHSSLGPGLPPLNIGSQEQFTIHRDANDVGMFISHPFRSILDGRWLIQVTRRVNFADGRFAGTVQAALDIDYLDHSYSQMSLGDGMTIGLYRSDGTILIRTPLTRKFIGQVANGPYYRTIAFGPERGIIHAVNVLDGENGPPRIVAYSRLPHLPLLMFVSVPRAEVLKRWQTSRYIAVPLALALAIFVLAGGAMLSRQIRRNERQQHDLVQATRRAEAATAAALHASQAKTAFLASMSHELRTPLNAVIGYSQLTQLDAKSTATQKEHAESVLKAGYHLLNLVNQVLDMAGIEAGKLKLEFERVGTADKLEGVRRTLLPTIERHGVTMSVECAPDVADVRADVMRLRQVLLNLGSNAIKYNFPGGKVVLRAENTGTGHVRFTIEDNGRGIKPERQAEIFQPFARLGAEFTATEGTGLGLAISKQIIEAMDGRIGFHSIAGRGSRFWFELPAAPAQTAASDNTAPAELMPASRPDQTRSILYVEDIPENLKLVALLCSTRRGLSLLPALTPDEGLHLALAHRPDIIILDINLPGMNGYEVLARLKAMPEMRDTPVLALTSAAMPDDARRGLSAGFFRYLTKPIDVNAFFRAVDEALEERDRNALRRGA